MTIAGKISVVSNGEGERVQLTIEGITLEEFKEKYPNINKYGVRSSKETECVGFTLNEELLYVTGSAKSEGNIITMYVKSVNNTNSNVCLYDSQKIKALFNFNGEEIQVTNISKDPLKLKEEEAERKQQELQDQLAQANTNLETAKKEDEEALKANNPDLANLQKQLQAKDQEITQLKQQPNAEVESLKKDLQAQKDKVQQLEKKNKELEAKNKTTEQPKQGNGAKYTATVGMGLAAGLVAFTALERTVRLEMLVMIGIAVASALVAGGITYAVLPSTQVNGAKAQEADKDKKKG